ncbi:glycine zipper 2TM domain-containing protein [Pseudoduganella armeniaca]|uniref:glycine zipper 2TM domain-containing protein n=1 Tax=Pseudoduganella armeniaca TaxID=2072590 RepID=UPI001E5AB827|nr:glycine zipper 2TM domain-containing protein [Pseudoduganella armeniaca]
MAPLQLAGQSGAQPLSLQPQQPAAMPQPALASQAAPERAAAQEAEYREPAPRKPAHAPVRSYAARHPQPAPAPAPVVQESKPNYVAIGTGAVVGGLLGNQVGHGNGKKLATLAGIIGGGYVGNEIANRNK